MASLTPTPSRSLNLGKFTAYATWLCWMVILAGTRYMPDFFEHRVVLWTSFSLVAIGAPLTILFGIQHAMKAGSWKAVCVMLLAGGTPFCANVALRTHEVISADLVALSIADFGTLPRFSMGNLLEESQSLQGEAEDRRRGAWLAYNLYGLKVMWRNESGALEVFAPDEGEIREMEESLSLDRELHQRVRDLWKTWRLNRKLLTLHLCAFFTVFFPGLLLLIWRQRRGK